MKKIILISLIVSCIGCSHKSQVHFDPSFGSEIKAEYRTSQIIKSDIICRYPIKLEVLDSIFIVQNLGSNELIQLYDKSGNYISCLVKQGEAPNEVPTLSSTFITKENKIHVYSTPTIKKYDPIKYLRNEKDYCTSIQIDDKLFAFPIERIRIINDSYFLEGFTEKMRFAIFDKKNSPIIYKEYPNIIGNYSSEKTAQVMSYACKTCFSPDHKFWIQGSYIGGTLEIFKKENNQIIPVNQIFIYPSIFKDLGNGVTWGNETIIGVDDIYATSKYIYVLLNGTTGDNLKSNSPVNPFSNKLIILDWQGNLIKKVETDCMIMTLAVDSSDLFCHVISFGDDGYDLRKITF